jgi:hypothetical protein
MNVCGRRSQSFHGVCGYARKEEEQEEDNEEEEAKAEEAKEKEMMKDMSIVLFQHLSQVSGLLTKFVSLTHCCTIA